MTDTAVVVTADHGGVGRLHDDISDSRSHTVPFVVWAPVSTPGPISMP